MTATGDECESIMSRTSVKAAQPTSAASVVSSLTASVQPSNRGGKAPSCVSQQSKATTTVTVALQRQIQTLEKQLETERTEREEAARRILATQKELDALEKILRLKPV